MSWSKEDMKLFGEPPASTKVTMPDNRFKRFTIEIEWTPKYCWYLIPTIEINTAVKEIAINIFCIGIYIPFGKK